MGLSRGAPAEDLAGDLVELCLALWRAQVPLPTSRAALSTSPVGPAGSRRFAVREDDRHSETRRRLPLRRRDRRLTPEQGGHQSGPPTATADRDYAATAYVPPHTLEGGLSSFVLRGFATGAWRSAAEGCWLVVPNEGAQSAGRQRGRGDGGAEGSRLLPRLRRRARRRVGAATEVSCTPA